MAKGWKRPDWSDVPVLEWMEHQSTFPVLQMGNGKDHLASLCDGDAESKARQVYWGMRGSCPRAV